MALFHFSAAQVKRSAGQSAIACAAYRAGEKLFSDYYGEYSDYTRKGGVIFTEIQLPANAPKSYSDRATLWNAVEEFEKHPKAQLAYSFDVALQNELSMDENIELARQFVRENFVAKGMIADLAVHVPDKEGGIENPHFHVMTTMRPLNADGSFGPKQRREYALDEDGNRLRDEAGNYIFNAVHTTDWHEPETLENWRAQWCKLVNDTFERKGLTCRIDHRSFERQGIEEIPTVHEGPKVRKMEARGIATEKGELNRWIKSTNNMLRNIRRKLKLLFEWMESLKEELSKPKEQNLVDYLNAHFANKNANAYSNKYKAITLKEFARVVNYLTENNLFTVEDLERRLHAVQAQVDQSKNKVKGYEARMKKLRDQLRYLKQYNETKPIFDEMNRIKWKGKREKFQESHDQELRMFYVSRRMLDGIPITPKKWEQELAALEQAHKNEYQVQAPLYEELKMLWKVKIQVEQVRQAQQPHKQHQHEIE